MLVLMLPAEKISPARELLYDWVLAIVLLFALSNLIP